MAVVVEPEKPQAHTTPDAGVIRDAHARRTRRRRRIAGAVIALAAFGTLIAGLVGTSSPKSTASGHGRALIALQRAKQRRRSWGWYISPALEGGSYGWCVMGEFGGSCATVPTLHARRVGGLLWAGDVVGGTTTEREAKITVLLSPDVRGVLADGRPTTLITRRHLPYGLRIVQVDFARAIPRTARSIGGTLSPPRQRARERAGQPALPPPTPMLVAISASGKPLAEMGTEPMTGPSIRWWERPERPALGPCQIHAQGLPTLQAEWGHVAATIRPYPKRIAGRAFFSCADTEYYLHNWPLETAILLDAQHPGRPPAPIPYMKALPNKPGLYSSPGDWHGEITATRKGNTWLVVAGGSGLRQREEVLAHLRASITL